MFQKLFKREYRHLNKIHIGRSALEHNHRVLQSFHPEAKIVPVLKSNAYGHGLQTVAYIFDALGAPFLVVDSLYEAYVLAQLKVKTPILILGYTHPENFAVKQLPFHITVFDLEVARSLHKHQKHCHVHIFVDTGMNREGVPLTELSSFVREMKKLNNLQVVGLASHFADADNPQSDSLTQSQLTNYQHALTMLKQQGIVPEFRHISASGGAFKLKDKTFTMIRAGLASYGINPLEASDPAHNKLTLKPALTFTSTLAQIKTVHQGDRVGYNGSFIADKEMVVGLLPLGYYEGIDRRLSNQGVITLQGAPCPILGRVSMNMTVVDLTAASNPAVGDEVVIYSSSEAEPNSLVNAARAAGTIPYELLVHMAESVKRVVVK